MGIFILLSLTAAIAWAVYTLFTQDDDHDDWDDSWGI